ncbi:adenylosuccinate lyase, partial [Virgibacillus halodenitrificans]|nr:adenylosuccinate lyase [Virgibacillus halodenitrificans]
RVLLSLIDKGMAREAAYDIVQPKAMQAWETATHFKDLVEAEEEITTRLTPEEINACFDYTYHLKNVDFIFERIGLTEGE